MSGDLLLSFRLDDLLAEPTRALIAQHLAEMRANSPPCSVHALDIDQLQARSVVARCYSALASIIMVWL